MNTPETNELIEDLNETLDTELRIFCREKWNAAIDDRDNAILEAKKLREQNTKLREIAENAIDWLHLGPSYDIRVASYIRKELDKLKEGEK